MHGMTVIVKTVTRWVKVFIFLFGVSVTLTGHLSPGGGFAGGVIIACSYILLTLTYGKVFALERFGLGTAEGLDSLGALLFVAVGLLGLGWGAPFFANVLQRHLPGLDFRLLSSGTIPISNIAIAVKVGASLFAVFVVLSVLRIVQDPATGKTRMVQSGEEE